jgi:hypothetical protein
LHPKAIFVSDWSISKKSSLLKPLGQIDRNLVGSILGRHFINIDGLDPIRSQTWPQQAILVSHWLISKNSCSLKPLCEMNRNMVESIFERLSIKITYLVPICKKTWRHRQFFFSDWSIFKKSSPLKPLGQMD